MSVKTVRIHQLPAVTQPADELPGAYWEVEVLSGSQLDRLNKKLTTEQLVTYLQGVLSNGGGPGGVSQADLDAVAQTLPATATQTAAYSLALADAGQQVPVDVATAANVTIPADDVANFPVGTILEISQEGAGQLTLVGGPIAAGGTVDVQAPGNAVKTSERYAIVALRKKAANVWRVQGGVA